MKLINRVQTGKRAVYDIEVEEAHEFYANNVLVHNCATDGGISIIKDNGTVVDISQSTSYTLAYEVAFTKDNKVAYIMDSANSSRTMRVDSIPASDFVVTSNQLVQGSGEEFYGMSDFGSGLNLFLSKDNNSYIRDVVVANDNNRIIGCDNNIAIVAPNLTNPSKGSVAYITSDYNTGWMNGDIKLATLSDTDATDVVGTELVTNGTFDSDTAGWYTNSQGSFVSTSGAGVLTNTQSGDRLRVYDDFDTVVGKTYTVTFDSLTTGLFVHVSNGTDYYVANLGAGVGSHSYTFIANTTTATLQVGLTSTANGFTASIDNVSVRLAEEDRSVNGNGLQVFGTVTKTPVATGADLVGYSGFSASNYLQQPYNSDLDFGIGDFSVMGWYRVTTTSTQRICGRNNNSTANKRFSVYSTGNSLVFYFSEGGAKSAQATIATTGEWQHFTCVRKYGIIQVFVNGVGGATEVASNDITVTGGQSLYVGAENFGGSTNSPLDQGSLALFRISATAPSAEQIAKIYNDEKPLFQENAQATLYGTSDAVTALAYDDDTELLHAGTSSGRSVFQGLRRVSNTTDAVTTSISASNSIIVEE